MAQRPFLARICRPDLGHHWRSVWVGARDRHARLSCPRGSGCTTLTAADERRTMGGYTWVTGPRARTALEAALERPATEIRDGRRGWATCVRQSLATSNASRTATGSSACSVISSISAVSPPATTRPRCPSPASPIRRRRAQYRTDSGLVAVHRRRDKRAVTHRNRLMDRGNDVGFRNLHEPHRNHGEAREVAQAHCSQRHSPTLQAV